ncbi:MAG TPA: hypothetical protein VFM88_00405 [Vicinamibacteria bacterium]|nr:hypothetical protein [Vicinamibacteria bacterium]
MRRFPPPLVVVALASLAACSNEYPNPFDDPSLISTVPPPDGTTIVFSTDGWSSVQGSGRELMAVATDGSLLTRLTFCHSDSRPCDIPEGALAADNERSVVRRVVADTNGDGRLDERDDASLVYVDLAARVEAELLPSTARVTGIDWVPSADVLVYSAQGAGGEDLFRTTPRRPTSDNAQETVDLSCPNFGGGTANCDTGISERRPRIDAAGSVAAYARIAAGGASEVWVFQTTVNQTRVTTAPAGGELLPGTPYRAGSDTDPSYSPDGRSLVFRHLVAVTSDGRGVWELRTVRPNGTELFTPVSRGSWLGAPDWGADGIAFPEADASGTRLMLIQPDGTGARPIVSFPAGTRLDNPRWLRR